MKKYFIIFINIFILFLIILLFDFLCYNEELDKYRGSKEDILTRIQLYNNYYDREVSDKYLKQKYIYGTNKDFQYRETINQNSQLSPIVLFGCSYTYGHKISLNKIPSAVMGKYLRNPIYNRSYHGAGPQLMLYQLEEDAFYTLMKEPVFILYTIIEDHRSRIYYPVMSTMKDYLDLFYKKETINEKTKLVRIKNNKYFLKPCFVYNIWREIVNNYYRNEDLEFLKLHFIQAKNCMSKHWKNTKMIIFVYECSAFEYMKEIEKELEENGIIVIYKKDIAPYDDSDTKFCLSKKDPHPNEKAWEYIMPKLLREIKRKGINY